MADQKLSELSYVTGVTSSDLVYVVQNGLSHKISASSLTASVLSGLLSNSSHAMIMANGPYVISGAIELTADWSNDITGIYLDRTGEMQLYTSGNVAIYTNTQGYTFNWTFNADGTATWPTPGYVPSTATSTGVAGTVTWDSGYVYVCVATNTWRRASLNSW